MKFVAKAMLRVMLLSSLLSPAPLLASGYQVGYTYTDFSGAYTLAADGYWYSAGVPFTLHERSERVWNARKYCYEYVTYYTYKPVVVQQVQVNDKNFYTNLTDRLAQREENERRAALLEAVYGQGSGSYSRSLKVYGNYPVEKRVELFSEIDVNLALQQMGHNNQTNKSLTAEGDRLFASSIDRLVSAAFQLKAIDKLKEAAIDMRKAEGPTAVYQEKGVRPQLQIDPVGEALDAAKRNEIMRDRLLNVDPKMHMPKGKGMMQAEDLADWIVGKNLAAIDEKYNCTTCHQRSEVKFRIK